MKSSIVLLLLLFTSGQNAFAQSCTPYDYHRGCHTVSSPQRCCNPHDGCGECLTPVWSKCVCPISHPSGEMNLIMDDLQETQVDVGDEVNNEGTHIVCREIRHLQVCAQEPTCPPPYTVIPGLGCRIVH